jgi:hypothetical protein
MLNYPAWTAWLILNVGPDITGKRSGVQHSITDLTIPDSSLNRRPAYPRPSESSKKLDCTRV